METKEKLSESISIHKVRVRKKENGRMKLHINLTKEEGEAFTNFMNAVNVQNLSEQEFTKAAFVIGLQAMEQSVIAEMQKRVAAEQEKAQQESAEENVEFVEDEASSEEESADENSETQD